MTNINHITALRDTAAMIIRAYRLTDRSTDAAIRDAAELYCDNPDYDPRSIRRIRAIIESTLRD